MTTTPPPAAQTRAPLLPCPFCNEALVLSTMRTSAEETQWWAHRDPLHSKCYAAGFMIDVDDAEEIAAWNKRATPAERAGDAALGVEAKMRALEADFRQRAHTLEVAIAANPNAAPIWTGEAQGGAKAFKAAADALAVTEER
jgi:hypothetical protein